LSLRQNYLDALARLVLAGLAGVSLASGLSSPGVRCENPLENHPGANEGSVLERLSAVRDAVSQIVGPDDKLRSLRPGDTGETAGIIGQRDPYQLQRAPEHDFTAGSGANAIKS
jgi:hypothetical protein